MKSSFNKRNILTKTLLLAIIPLSLFAQKNKEKEEDYLGKAELYKAKKSLLENLFNKKIRSYF
ncbi:MAG: hypothetical protein HZB98_15445 [Bacteroidia bacterium]|nr:hypothetical protein [Bacteroidia bacterium]